MLFERRATDFRGLGRRNGVLSARTRGWGVGEGKPLFTEPREAAKRAVWMLAWETQLTSIEADRCLLNQFFPVMCARTSGLLGWSYCKLLPWQLLWFPTMAFGNSGAVREVKAKEGVSEWRRGRCSRGQRQHTKTVTF